MDRIMEEKLKRNLDVFTNLVGCAQLKISREIYPYSEYRDDPQKYNDQQWDYADKPGVYIFVSNDKDNPLYIGKCEGFLGNRIFAHLGKTGKGTFPNAEGWIKSNIEKVCFITIPVDPPQLAPVLESFLIYKLTPENNKEGK